MSGILIKNARMIDPGGVLDRVGNLFIDGGIICAAEGIDEAEVDKVIDASGLVAAPGIVDMHVHLRDPGFTDKEDIFSACEAAAAGGVTSVAAMPNTSPVADSAEVIRYIVEKAAGAKARVYPIAAASKGLGSGEIPDYSLLKKAGAVAISDDGKPFQDAKTLSEILEKANWVKMPVLAHCEDLSLAGNGIMNEGVIAAALGAEGIPTSAESVGTARDVCVAMATGLPIHICHVSTAVAVEQIRFAKQNGVKITAETCPHYFMLNEEVLLHEDADYRMNPPLRSDMDRFAVIRGIIDGTIDVIATDHAPHTAEEKSDFFTAPNGAVGLETSLAAGITALVNKGYISLFKLLYMMSTVPAKLLGIDGGSLAVGAPADIMLFDPEEKWTVYPDKLHSKSKNTPFKGMKLTGKVKYTLCGGRLVFEDK